MRDQKIWVTFFEKQNIKVIYNEFIHPIYRQFNSKNFTPNLSIIDLIFNYMMLKFY